MGSNSHSSFIINYISSSTFTVPKGVKKIDVFCVGGGCGGFSSRSDDCSDSYNDVGGGGGGGGYTATKLGVDVNPGQQLSVVVGGASSTSSVGSICSAEGAKYKDNSPNSIWADGNIPGGNGGSGGGHGSCFYTYPFDTSRNAIRFSNTKGGTDGSDGELASGFSTNIQGKGQHSTTRYFGESTGTLYSTGGNGGKGWYGYPHFTGFSKPEVKTDNTGDGGDGNNGKGASGICIIRWSGK